MKSDSKEWEDFVRFLTKKCENVVSPMTLHSICSEYTCGSFCFYSEWKDQINEYRNNIPKREDIDNHLKAKMMFGLSVPVDAELLEKFREEAVVETDTKDRIIEYVANDGSLTLKGDHRHIGKFQSYSNEEKNEERMISFLVNKCENIVSPLNIVYLCEELNRFSGSSMSCSYWATRIKKYRLKIHEIVDLDVSTKVKMMLGLSASLDLEFLDKLKNYAFIYLDDQNRIIRYDSKDGNLQLGFVHPEYGRDRIVDTENGMIMVTHGIVGTTPESAGERAILINCQVLLPMTRQNVVDLGEVLNGLFVPGGRPIFCHVINEDVDIYYTVNEQQSSFIGCFAMIDLSGIKNDFEKSRERIPPLLKTSVSTILIALRKGERIISESARRYIDDESISLKLVLLQLRRFVSSFGLPELNGFEKYLSEKSDKLSLIHQGVPIRKLKQFIETTLRIVWSDMELI